jgi:hypothetical protein
MRKRDCNCEDVYNCCDCGGNGCGCGYCWSCNACEDCLSGEDDLVIPEIGQKATTNDGLQGEVVGVQDNITEIKLTDGKTIKRYHTQIADLY